MKKVLLVLGLAIGFIACEKETVIVIEDNDCEECVGATVRLAPEARGPVDRDGMYAWIDVITVVAEDDQGNDYGDVFNLVDDGTGADGFYLDQVPVNEIIDFNASSTSVTNSYNGFSMQQTTTPLVLDSFVNRMPYAEYATDVTVSEYIQSGENIVQLQMNTLHGRLISSFRLADDIQYMNTSTGSPMYRLRITSGSVEEWSTVSGGVVSYFNGPNSTAGTTVTYTVSIESFMTGASVYSTTITEDVVASTSISTKYVVGLGFVDSTGVEVIFSWQVWNEEDGDNGNGTSPNGLDCSSCGAVTNQNVAGSYSLTADTVISDKNLVIAGDLNLNGYTLTVTCGDVTVSGNFNGGGTLIAAGNLVVTGATQNNPDIYANECF